MEVRKAEFATSAVEPMQYPSEDLPHITLVGKSNVGKSSLINSLANNYKLARTSARPGKTRLINFYKFNDALYIVDLPGYGFAQVPISEKMKWQDMVEDYFSSTKNIILFIHVVDIRHSPTQEDIQMMEWIKYFHFPVIVAAMKADKLGKTRWKASVRRIRESLVLPNGVPIIPFSSYTGAGRKELLQAISRHLSD